MTKIPGASIGTIIVVVFSARGRTLSSISDFPILLQSSLAYDLRILRASGRILKKEKMICIGYIRVISGIMEVRMKKQILKTSAFPNFTDKRDEKVLKNSVLSNLEKSD